MAKGKTPMISLNLIPPQKKEELNLRQFYIVIKNLTIIFLLFTIFIAVVLMIAKITLQNNFNEVVANSTLTTKYGRILNTDIENFNKQLSLVNKIQGSYFSWTSFMNKFILIIPDNVSLYNLNIESSEENQIIINGFAKTRDNLLKFKSNLESFSLLSDIDIPLDYLLKKENIDFQVEGKINLDQLANL
ncbi:MAG: hypothetical protein WC508_00050 [Patescibacteria group bacterium]